MDELSALQAVRDYLQLHAYDYPRDDLVAERFSAGWTVFSPVRTDVPITDIPIGRAVFLIGDDGLIEESSSSFPPGVAERDFAQRHSPQR